MEQSDHPPPAHAAPPSPRAFVDALRAAAVDGYVPPRRGFAHALAVHAGVRLKHAALTWGYLKPFVLRDLSRAYDRRFPTHPPPDIDFAPYLQLKLQWLASAFFQQVPALTVPYVLSRLLHLNHRVFEALERDLLRACERRGPPSPRTLPVPEFDWRDGSPERFVREFVRQPFPVVLRGFAAGRRAARVFTYERILECFGDERVLLTTHQKDGFEGRLAAVRDPSVYCHNSEMLFNKYPALKRELELDRLLPYSDGKREAFCQLFIGRRGTGSPFHCAAVWNWFHMFDGRKRWSFVDPNHSLFLYPLHAMGRTATTAHCSFPDRYNREAYPLFAYCPFYSVELDPGDVMLVPPWWWHCVENLTEESVAVATRWHVGGIAGHGLVWTEEDYDVSRLMSVLTQVGVESPLVMQRLLTNPSKVDEGHTTLRERRSRFIDTHYRLSSGRVRGIYHKM